MNCQFCKTPLTQQPGANTCARCFEYLDLTTGLPDLEYARKCENDAKERRTVTAEETERRERAQAPRLGYPGADQMMRWQRDYK